VLFATSVVMHDKFDRSSEKLGEHDPLKLYHKMQKN